MPFIKSADVNLYYETHGPPVGQAPAIVFAHGAGGNHLSWWQQVPHFRKRHTCVVFDHRGFGQSVEREGGRGGAAFTDDLLALLDALGIERATLVAQSMGGWTSLGFALRHPHRVERLLMSDTHGGLSSPEIDALMAEVPARIGALAKKGLSPAVGERMYVEQRELAFLYEEISALNPPRDPRALGGLLLAAGSPPLARVAELSMPLLIVAGDEDVLIAPRILELVAAAAPGSRLVRVPEAGHSVYFERANTFNAILDEFLCGS
jgi:3-oxoadipate enol-lactonase